jgi:hypothetical protein
MYWYRDTCIHILAYVYTRTHIYTYACIHIRIHTHIHIHEIISHMSTCKCDNIHKYMFMNLCIYTYMHLYIHAYTSTCICIKHRADGVVACMCSVGSMLSMRVFCSSRVWARPWPLLSCVVFRRIGALGASAAGDLSTSIHMQYQDRSGQESKRSYR